MVTVTPYSVSIDEWGHFVDSALDEWGQSYFDTLTDLGELVYEVEPKITTTDTAHAGSVNADTVAGSRVYVSETANDGDIVGSNTVFGGRVKVFHPSYEGIVQIHLTVEGSRGLTTDFALGSQSEKITGTSATSISIANAGIPFVDKYVTGTSTSTTETAFTGGPPKDVIPPTTVILDEWGTFTIDDLDEWGQTHFDDQINEFGEFLYETVARPNVRTTANAGTPFVQFGTQGSSTTTTTTAHAGIPVKNIVVLGSTVGSVHTVISGGIGFLVFGQTSVTLETPSSGKATTPTIGSQAATTATASAGIVVVDAILTGSSVMINDEANVGRPRGGFVEVILTARATGGLSYATV